MTEMVERVRNAILTSGGFHVDATERQWAEGAARAVIRAMREPTEGMAAAAIEAEWTRVEMGQGRRFTVKEYWQTMIDAALKPNEATAPSAASPVPPN